MISRVAFLGAATHEKGNAMTTRKPDAEIGTTGAARRGVAAEAAEETVRGGDFMRAPIFVDTRAAAELLRKLIEVAQHGAKGDRDQQLIQAPLFVDIGSAAAVIRTILGTRDDNDGWRAGP